MVTSVAAAERPLSTQDVSLKEEASSIGVGSPGSDAGINWPVKYDVLGVGVSACTYDQCCDVLLEAAKRGMPAIASFHAVHAIVESATSASLLAKVNRFDIVAPDGQPVRWMLNGMYGLGLKDRVYGPELTRRICGRAAEEGVGVYLYGGSPKTLEKLQIRLKEMFPKLIISGAESPPFRPLTDEEDKAVVERVNASGAGLFLIGLGCPKQDHFAADHAGQILPVQLCVGAAFDFHAGSKPMAPRWMQGAGLEWAFRLVKEPRRLWKRYLVTNTLFVVKSMHQIVFGTRRLISASGVASPISSPPK